MQEAINKAITADPEWKERLRESNSLILLANGCINEPNLQGAFEKLLEALSLPDSEETFTRYIKERYGKAAYSIYWVIGRPDYWIEHSRPNFPLEILIYPNKEREEWQAWASYVVPGNRENIPKTENTYIPVHDLFNQLEARFFLVCPIV